MFGQLLWMTAMLYRKTNKGLLCIDQPTHAWVAGQLARAWGNDRFGSFTPWEEVCLGAEQHDIGWLKWEAAPTLNPETGYPHAFAELPTSVSVGIWSEAHSLATPLGPYATLLVSLHGTGLFQRHTGWQKSTEVAPLVRAYLSQETVFQQQLITVLQDDPHYAEGAVPEAIARNRQLVASWDTLSLMLCFGVHQPSQIQNVPAAQGETSLTLAPVEHDPAKIAVAPWSFQTRSVELTFTGRLLQAPFADEETMRTGLAYAPRITVSTTLVPAD